MPTARPCGSAPRALHADLCQLDGTRRWADAHALEKREDCRPWCPPTGMSGLLLDPRGSRGCTALSAAADAGAEAGASASVETRRSAHRSVTTIGHRHAGTTSAKTKSGRAGRESGAECDAWDAEGRTARAPADGLQQCRAEPCTHWCIHEEGRRREGRKEPARAEGGVVRDEDLVEELKRRLGAIPGLGSLMQSR